VITAPLHKRYIFVLLAAVRSVIVTAVSMTGHSTPYVTPFESTSYLPLKFSASSLHFRLALVQEHADCIVRFPTPSLFNLTPIDATVLARGSRYECRWKH